MLPVQLPPDLESFVHGAVTSGRFATQEEVVVAALQSFRDIENQRERLREHVQEGIRDIEQGDYVEFDTPEELQAFFDDLNHRCLERYNDRRSVE